MRYYLHYYYDNGNKEENKRRTCKTEAYGSEGRMTKKVNGTDTQINPYNREQVRNLLSNNGIQLKNDQLYDSTYVANMCKADFLGSSVTDEKHLAMYIKDVIDDPDGYDGIVFNRWYADMCYTGVAIDWEDML